MWPRTRYLQLRGKLKAGEIKTEKTFREASEVFLREYDVITFGQRSKDYVRGQHSRSNVHLVPFFGKMGLSEITAGKVQEYRIHRLEETIARRGKPPAHNTMHQEFVTLRQTLKTAVRHGWLDRLPDLSEPYRSSRKYPTGRGFRRRSTRRSTKPRGGARNIPSKSASGGKASSFTIMFCFRRTQACGRMKRDVFSSGTWPSSTPAIKEFLRSRSAENAASATARACRPSAGPKTQGQAASSPG